MTLRCAEARRAPTPPQRREPPRRDQVGGVERRQLAPRRGTPAERQTAPKTPSERSRSKHRDQICWIELCLASAAVPGVWWRSSEEECLGVEKPTSSPRRGTPAERQTAPKTPPERSPSKRRDRICWIELCLASAAVPGVWWRSSGGGVPLGVERTTRSRLEEERQRNARRRRRRHRRDHRRSTAIGSAGSTSAWRLRRSLASGGVPPEEGLSELWKLALDEWADNISASRLGVVAWRFGGRYSRRPVALTLPRSRYMRSIVARSSSSSISVLFAPAT